MSDLQSILENVKAGLSPWERIPEAQWQGIADRCGLEEIAEIHSRIAALREELAATEAWDGDTSDDIHLAIEFFEGLLHLSDRKNA